MKFSPEKTEFAKGVIEFDEITCCALEQAFAKNRETVQRLQEIIGADELEKISNILPTTKSMAFIPSEDMKIAYSQIAKQEEERLNNQVPEDFVCKYRHTSTQHINALKLLVEKIEPRLN